MVESLLPKQVVVGSNPIARSKLMLEIVVNGETRSVSADFTIADLVAELALAGKRFAVEVNAEIVPRSQHVIRKFKAQDRVEIVHAIGGG